MEKARTRTWRRRAVAAACAVALCCGLAGALAGCGGGGGTQASSQRDSAGEAAQTDQAATRLFTDSAGRQVEVPAQIDKIAPSGHTAQQILLTMAPEKMVGLSQELSAGQLKYLGEQLPTTRCSVRRSAPRAT